MFDLEVSTYGMKKRREVLNGLKPWSKWKKIPWAYRKKKYNMATKQSLKLKDWAIKDHQKLIWTDSAGKLSVFHIHCCYKKQIPYTVCSQNFIIITYIPSAQSQWKLQCLFLKVDLLHVKGIFCTIITNASITSWKS